MLSWTGPANTGCHPAIRNRAAGARSTDYPPKILTALSCPTGFGLQRGDARSAGPECRSRRRYSPRGYDLQMMARGERIVEHKVAGGVPSENDRLAGCKVMVARDCQEQNGTDKGGALGRSFARPRWQSRQRGCARRVLSKGIHDLLVSKFPGYRTRDPRSSNHFARTPIVRLAHEPFLQGSAIWRGKRRRRSAIMPRRHANGAADIRVDPVGLA